MSSRATAFARKLSIVVAVVAGLLALWQFVTVAFAIPPYILPTPDAVGRAVISSRDTLAAHPLRPGALCVALPVRRSSCGGRERGARRDAVRMGDRFSRPGRADPGGGCHARDRGAVGRGHNLRDLRAARVLSDVRGREQGSALEAAADRMDEPLSDRGTSATNARATAHRPRDG